MKTKWLLLVLGIVILLGGVFFYYWQYWRILPDEPETYYRIFNKNEILSGRETTAEEVNVKLDKRLARYQGTFAKIAGTNDQEELKALFYMNFVHLSAPYGKNDLTEKSLDYLLWKSEYHQCGSYTIMLSMLLEKAGYEQRTVSIDSGGHGYVEIKFDERWQILDPTTNIWIDKSTEELIAGDSRNIKNFFLMAEDLNNARAREHFGQVKVNVIHLRDRYMFKLGQSYSPKIDGYNYIDLKQYQY